MTNQFKVDKSIALEEAQIMQKTLKRHILNKKPMKTHILNEKPLKRHRYLKIVRSQKVMYTREKNRIKIILFSLSK